MNPFHRSLRCDLQRGSAAVELAVVLTFVLVPLLSVVLFLGKYYWYYTVAQKAAHDAALYMSMAPLAEIKRLGAPGLAESIMTSETQDMDGVTLETRSLTANCGYRLSSVSNIRYIDCNSTLKPEAVQASVVVLVNNPFIFVDADIPIVVVAQMPYTGR